MSLITDIDTRRSEQDHQARRELEDEYREHAATVDRYLAGTFGTALAADERETLRQQAFVGLADEIAKGTNVQNIEAMLITCARNAAYSLLRSADRRRRFTFDPQNSPEARQPDPATAPVDVAVIDADEDRRVKMLVDQLDERSRRVLQMRLEFAMEMPEIAAHLGISTSHAYKLLKAAGTGLADSIAANNAGAHSRQQRALLTAYELGTATDQQRDQAERMLAADTHARVLLAEIRGLSHQAAALMPPVAVAAAAPPSSGRISHMLSSVKQQVSDLVGRGGSAQEAATQVAAGGGLRGGGAVSQAVVAGVLACMGAGGYAATVCVTEGPAALVDKLPGTDNPRSQPRDRVVEAPVTPVVEPLTTVPEQVAAPVEPTPADSTTDAQAASEPTPTPPTASDSLSGLNGNPTATPAPAPAPPPAASGGGASGGSSGTSFGGL